MPDIAYTPLVPGQDAPREKIWARGMAALIADLVKAYGVLVYAVEVDGVSIFRFDSQVIVTARTLPPLDPAAPVASDSSPRRRR